MTDEERLESQKNQENILERQEFAAFLEKETDDPGFFAQAHRSSLVELANPTVITPMGSSEESQIRPLSYVFLNHEIPYNYPDKMERVEFRTKLFCFTAAVTIERMLDVLSDESIAHFIEFLKYADYEKDGEEIHSELKEYIDSKDEGMWEDLKENVEKLLSLRRLLRKFVIDRVDSDTGKQILLFPFNEGDSEEEPWKSILDITANLGHSLDKVAGIDKIFEYFFKQQFSIPDDLTIQRQVHSLSGAQKLLNGYKRQLLKVEKSEPIKDWSFLEDVKHMLQAQFGDKMGQLPIDIEVVGQPVLNNADEDEITIAILEIARGAFAKGKVTAERLEELNEAGESYLYIKVEEITDESGMKLVCIAVMDKGTSIDVRKITEQEKLEQFNWSTIIEVLTRKGVTYGNGNGHKGLGLYVACQIVQSHNGDLYGKNTEDGVGFLIAMPVEGKDCLSLCSFPILKKVQVVINPDVKIVKEDLQESGEDFSPETMGIGGFNPDDNAYTGFVVAEEDE